MLKGGAILGGGIGGLSAAHELTGEAGRGDLPGEHGFRFFPAFCQNVIDTMARTPTTGSRTVADNLVGCTEMAMAEPGRAPSILPRQRPRSTGEFFRSVAVPAKMLDYLTTCDDRGSQPAVARIWHY